MATGYNSLDRIVVNMSDTLYSKEVNTEDRRIC